MNSQTYSVLSNDNIGGIPTVQSRNSVTYWEMMNIGYTELETRTKRHCNDFADELASQLLEVNFYHA